MIKFLKSIFRRRVQIKTVIIHRQATKMRLHEWQADATLANNARRLLDDPTAQLMLSVLHNEHPAFMVVERGTPLQDRAVQQALCEGYTICIANLEAMARHVKMSEMPEAEFQPEEINQQK